MNKKTAIAVALIAFFAADAHRCARKHNELAVRYNTLLQDYQEMQAGAEYFKQVSLAAFKRLPVNAIPEVQNDVDFLHIMHKEGL